MEGDIPSTPCNGMVQTGSVTPDDASRPLEDGESRKSQLDKHLNAIYADITFRKVVRVIRKSLKKRRDQVNHSVIVSGGILPSELEQASLNIENATITEMAEFRVPGNRRIIVRHTIGLSAPRGAEVVEIDIPYYSTITISCGGKLKTMSILCYQASRVRLGMRGSK